MPGQLGWQTCGIHTYKITGNQGTGGNFVQEVYVTANSDYQWSPSGGTALIKSIDAGAEYCWNLAGGCTSDFYNTVWAVDMSGHLYNMFFQTYGLGLCGVSCGCANGNDVTTLPYRPLCKMTTPLAGPVLPTGWTTGYQWVSSGGGYTTGNLGQCNVAVIGANKAFWGAYTYSVLGVSGTCEWKPITVVGSTANIISVANALDTMFLITANYKIYKLDSIHNFAGSALTMTAQHNITSSWTSTTVNPVFIDAWNATTVRVVGSDGSLWRFDVPTGNFMQVTFPTGTTTCGVFITKDSSGNIVFPTNAYLNVGQDAVYFSDAHNDATSGCAPNCVSSPCTQTWDNNWRIAFS
jgi:hypothetical protein